MSDADPRKQLIRRELTNRDDIDDPEEIWGRAVPIKVPGDALPISRTAGLIIAFLGPYIPYVHIIMHTYQDVIRLRVVGWRLAVGRPVYLGFQDPDFWHCEAHEVHGNDVGVLEGDDLGVVGSVHGEVPFRRFGRHGVCRGFTRTRTSRLPISWELVLRRLGDQLRHGVGSECLTVGKLQLPPHVSVVRRHVGR